MRVPEDLAPYREHVTLGEASALLALDKRADRLTERIDALVDELEKVRDERSSIEDAVKARANSKAE